MMINERELNKTLALAGVFQAASLIELFATTGKVPQASFTESIDSIFQIEPGSVNEIYNADNRARLGLETLIESLLYPKQRHTQHWLRYSKAMIRMERIITRRKYLHKIIRSRLEHHKHYATFFESNISKIVISKLAGLYVDIAGELSYRILIRGNPSLLLAPEQNKKVCATLLAGIRSANLWRQLGGSEWDLIFQKESIITASKQLALIDSVPPKTSTHPLS